MSPEARNFLLENSPNATFTMELPEQEEPTKAQKAKEAREKKRAKLVADIERHMTELQVLLQQKTTLSERNQAREKTKTIAGNFMAELQQALTKKEMTQSEPERLQIKEEVAGLTAQIHACLDEMINLIEQTYNDIKITGLKKFSVRSLLDDLPKRQKTVMESRYSAQLQEIETFYSGLLSTFEDTSAYLKEIIQDVKKTRNSQDVSSSNLQLPRITTTVFVCNVKLIIPYFTLYILLRTDQHQILCKCHEFSRAARDCGVRPYRVYKKFREKVRVIFIVI